MREFALLWFLFALLDMMIEDRLTPRWGFWNGAFSVVLWALGSYIEMRRYPGDR